MNWTEIPNSPKSAEILTQHCRVLNISYDQHNIRKMAIVFKGAFIISYFIVTQCHENEQSEVRRHLYCGSVL